MKRLIVHLSDLHFGRIDPATLDPLVESIREMRPDLIAVSGDLTQRARRKEFEQARDFLKRLPLPQIVVPGNHDIPLYNPCLRFISKWSRFREYIDPEPEQSYVDEAMAVIGVNTSRALTWKGGRISGRQIESVRSLFCSVGKAVLKVLVVHHPIDIPFGWSPGMKALRARRALGQWADCGIDMILAGHAHRALAGGDVKSLQIGHHHAVIVQAGTATSTRGRGELNSFNAIHVDQDQILVIRETWNAGANHFKATHEDAFNR
jgi:3',5'-cyclic AMP phosphodiesterase CpdA